MPYDITMCSGGDCTLKDHCIRFTGAVYGRQDYFGSVPFDETTKNCQYYLDDLPNDERVREYAYQLWQSRGCPEGDDLGIWLLAQNELLAKNRNS